MKAWRVGLGISQKACAEKLGVRQTTWGDWENGRKSPQIKQALRLATLTEGAVPVAAWGDDDAAKPSVRAGKPSGRKHRAALVT